MELLIETDELYASAIEELALVAATTNHHSARVGAINARINTGERRLRFLQEIGRLPTLPMIAQEFEVRQVAEAIFQAFDRFDLGPEVRDAVAAALDVP